MTDATRTLILLKPDAVARGLIGEVLRRIEAKGYAITALRQRTADQDLLAEHYAEHLGQPFYPGLVEFMGSGPLVAAIIEGNRVIEGVRALVGATDPTTAAPGSIRGDLGHDAGAKTHHNLIHASDSSESAAREIALWFPS